MTTKQKQELRRIIQSWALEDEFSMVSSLRDDLFFADHEMHYIATEINTCFNLKIEITGEEVNKCQTVKDLFDLVERKV